MRVKELLLTALSRANHIEDGTTAPSKELTKARNHFNSALSAYSDSNLITAFQQSVDVTGKAEQVLGKYNLKRGKVMHTAATLDELPDPSRLTPDKDFGQYDLASGIPMFARIATYGGSQVWMPVGGNYTPEQRLAQCDCTDYIPDKIVLNLERIVGAMAREPGSRGAWTELHFVPFATFYTSDETEIYCAKPAGDNKAKLFLPEELLGWDIRVIYNTSMKFQNDDYIELPEVYRELLTLATAVGLLSEDDDSDPSQLNNYQTMLTKLEHQIMANNANTRRMVRKDSNPRNNLLHSGRFICRR